MISMVSYHHVHYQKKLTIQSWENFDWRTDGRTDRWTRVIFIGRCPTNVKRPVTAVLWKTWSSFKWNFAKLWNTWCTFKQTCVTFDASAWHTTKYNFISWWSKFFKGFNWSFCHFLVFAVSSYNSLNSHFLKLSPRTIRQSVQI